MRRYCRNCCSGAQFFSSILVHWGSEQLNGRHQNIRHAIRGCIVYISRWKNMKVTLLKTPDSSIAIESISQVRHEACLLIIGNRGSKILDICSFPWRTISIIALRASEERQIIIRVMKNYIRANRDFLSAPSKSNLLWLCCVQLWNRC